MKWLTEEQWFDTYYPPEWGDWRKFFNAPKYQNSYNKTGCSFRDYSLTGKILRLAWNEIWGVDQPDGYTLDHLFIRVDPANHPVMALPIYQSKTDDYWLRITCQKLPEYKGISLEKGKFVVTISDDDDFYADKFFQTENEARTEIERLKETGITHDSIWNSGYTY